MKKLMMITMLLAACAAWAADTAQKTDVKPASVTASPAESTPKKAAAEKKKPGTMEKAGSSVKSGWHKFKKSVKQGRKKPACTPEQRSLKQCK